MRKQNPEYFGKGLSPHSSRHKGGFSTGVREIFLERSTAEPWITSSGVWGNSLCLRHSYPALAILLQPLNKDGSLSHHNYVSWIWRNGQLVFVNPSTAFFINHINLAVSCLLFPFNVRKTHFKLSHQWHSLPHSTIKANYLIGFKKSKFLFICLGTRQWHWNETEKRQKAQRPWWV